MQSHSRAHHSPQQLHWDPASVAITILVTLLFIFFLFVFLTLMATPAQGQNHVPATAAQAAKMPQFASKLAHPMRMSRPDNASRLPIQQRASYRNPNDARKRYGRTGPLDSGEIYDNGPINGTVDAWTINFGFVVSDSFPVPQQNSANGMNFVAWLFPGDLLQSVEISITSSEFGGTTYFDSVVNLTQSNCTTNQLGFSLCTESGTFPDVALNSDTYWVNLQNAVVNNGDPVYWDENSGPSMASQNSVGTIPSESFTIEGGNTGPTCFGEHPQNGFQVIHDYTGTSDGGYPFGVVTDKSSNVYGINCNDVGLCGALNTFKLSQAGQNWLYSILATLGGGQLPSAVPTVGPNGALYGPAAGGNHCGPTGGSCGSLYSLKPTTQPCIGTSCRWSDTLLYVFSDIPNGWDPTGNLIFDGPDHAFGTTWNGGIGGCPAWGCGTVYEVTNSTTGWTEQVLYSFPKSSIRDFHGAQPASLVLGHDGNLYGTTAVGGRFGYGSIYQLSPSPGGWTMTNLYSFDSNQNIDKGLISGLVQDQAGNLYGIGVVYRQGHQYGIIYQLSHEQGGWTFTILRANPDSDFLYNIAIGSWGILYGTGGNWDEVQATGYVYALRPTSGGWDFSTPVYFPNQIFPTNLPVALDPAGNLYGATSFCGRYGYGSVWRYSP